MMWKIVLICLVFALSSAQEAEEIPLPIVTITQGIVVGSVARDGNYFEFNGIPYADSTSGINRFKAPLPPPIFGDTFIASRKDIKCIRALGVGYEGTEDCLVANVYTPTIDSNSQLPVMVWIKGKEFDRQEQELSFKKFAEQEVIVVSLNYRESILGFLCLGTETAPGNAGLKDIIAGLRWVKENIAQFGGNPDDITLFGHGSGAAAVDLVTMSPMAAGLIQKAIAQSGNAIAPWAVTRNNLEYALKVAEGLGMIVTNIQELSDVFTRTSIGALMAVINELDLTDNSLAFAPCVERSNLQGIEPFITKSPSQILADGEFLQIPFITGFVDNEGTIRSDEALEHNWLQKMDASFTDFIQPDLAFNNEYEQEQIAQEIRTFYFGEDQIDLSTVDEYIAYQGDTMMLVSTIREARTRAFVSTAPTYLYQFSYKGTLGEPFVGPLGVESAAHSEELAYMFDDDLDDNIPMRDLTIGDILVERWSNFAKTGYPSSETSPVIWNPYTSINAYYLRILDNEEISDTESATFELSLQNPHPGTVNFWDQIYIEHFLDAESQWELTDRNDEDGEEIPDDESGENDGNGDNAGENEEDGNGSEETAGDGNENEVIEENSNENDELEIDNEDRDEDDIDEPSEDSASTAVAYTFSIISLFALLNHFHFSQISS